MMSTPQPESPLVETDTRFPSGPWTGFFLQPMLPGRHRMDLVLTFRDGTIRGEGRDLVGEFTFRGRYQLEDGKCSWTKAYVGGHRLTYQGFNESKGIWGTWEEFPWNRGGFHIWPVGMPDPTQARLAEGLEEPAATALSYDPIAEPSMPAEVGEPVASEVGGPIGRPIGLKDVEENRTGEG